MKYGKYCRNCKDYFSHATRGDAVFCSDACRVACNRRRKSASKSVKNIMSDLQKIRTVIKENKDMRDDLNQDLKRLRDEITDILRLTDRSTIEEEGEKAQLLSGYRSSRE